MKRNNTLSFGWLFLSLAWVMGGYCPVGEPSPQIKCQGAFARAEFCTLSKGTNNRPKLQQHTDRVPPSLMVLFSLVALLYNTSEYIFHSTEQFSAAGDGGIQHTSKLHTGECGASLNLSPARSHRPKKYIFQQSREVIFVCVPGTWPLVKHRLASYSAVSFSCAAQAQGGTLRPERCSDVGLLPLPSFQNFHDVF